MHRLFVALRPPPAMRDAILAAMGGIDHARWQSAEQLHVTLRFIGQVERPLAEDIAIALGNIAFPAFDLALAGVGEFQSRGRAHAVWARVTPRDAVSRLHRKIDQALVGLGLAPERRAYFPHITLARLNARSGSTERFLDHQAALTTPPVRFDNFLLFESTLGQEGARYEAIARYRLSAPDY
ncbi:RNA 2',3'-cyclic phosphodiesterase [Stakelama sp. CBK3Z-3]|uniref:RNA 2',3'-cyclic phosphodiesterase n=1 Tax=Stakelama flava TaxID=2860338 RepID=A0ABS6XLA5_9SPHN|nr:RNA 2',3'-cyclic phosphodiesterase [Stakelama flava]MBW4331004.1 RNA 2',3'-cyclic phosphodiesterase [Stakelama flava]